MSLFILHFTIQATHSEFSFRYDCTLADRLVLKCSNYYFPVCGWFSPDVKCFVYPCALNADNICEACKNRNVDYVTYGSCPESGVPHEDSQNPCGMRHGEIKNC